MLKRTITGVLLAIFVLAAVWLQGYFVVVPMTVATLVCIHEMLDCLKKAGKKPVEWASYLYALSMGVAQMIVTAQGGNMMQSLMVVQLVLALNVVIGFSAVVAKGKVDMESMIYTVVPMIYPGMFCALVYPLNCVGGKMITMIALALCFFVPNLNDVFAMLVGVKFGKRKMSPNLSPKKSWEGSYAGIVAAVVFAVVIPYLLRGIMLLFPYSAAMVTDMPAWWQFALLGIPTGIVAQFGA